MHIKNFLYDFQKLFQYFSTKFSFNFSKFFLDYFDANRIVRRVSKIIFKVSS